jgi:hypothetical protein
VFKQNHAKIDCLKGDLPVLESCVVVGLEEEHQTENKECSSSRKFHSGSFTARHANDSYVWFSSVQLWV